MNVVKTEIDTLTLVVHQKTSPRKCDICSVTLTTDLDVTKHLASDLHKDAIFKYKQSYHCKSKIIESQIPKNINQVFDNMNINYVEDLEDLADVGYFNIPDKKNKSVVDKMVNIIGRHLVEHKALRRSSEAKAESLKIYEKNFHLSISTGRSQPASSIWSKLIN